MPSYRIGRLGKRFAVCVYDDQGKRINRYRLRATDARQAAIEAPGVFDELTKPRGGIGALWSAYVAEHHDRAIVGTMVHNWKALAPYFNRLPADTLTVTDCRAYTAARRAAGIKDGTISTELGRLRMVLRWAEKRRLIARAPHIERPAAPRRTERHLTREQCRAIIDAATFPHVKLFVILALATGARDAALRELTWDRVDFDRGLIDLRNPDIRRPHKGRAIVPMNRAARAALLTAKESALSAYVIEWAAKPIGSVKKGLKAAARVAGGVAISSHLFRHSAAVHMAEAGITMEVIAQFLGHEDVTVTRRVYARFSPTYLRDAADVLQYDDLSTPRFNEPKNASQIEEIPLENLVGATVVR